LLEPKQTNVNIKSIKHKASGSIMQEPTKAPSTLLRTNESAFQAYLKSGMLLRDPSTLINEDLPPITYDDEDSPTRLPKLKSRRLPRQVILSHRQTHDRSSKADLSKINHSQESFYSKNSLDSPLGIPPKPVITHAALRQD
jgi:hypothetical protein